MSNPRRLRLLLVALLIPTLAGCFYSRRARDVESDPTVDTGMGASIILPGQTAPPMSMGTPVPAGAEASGAGNTVPRPNISMIGGSEIDKERHEEGKEDPLIFKALMTPLAVLAAPFVAAADAMKGDPEPSPAVPDQKTPRPDVEHEPPPQDYESTQTAGASPGEPSAARTGTPPNYETQEIERMERELARVQAAAPTPPVPAPAPRSSGSTSGSIADELASLQRVPARTPAPSQPVPAPVESTTRTQTLQVGEARVADGIVDRDEDGRIDLWIYRQDGDIVRKALDQDYDGRPDTTMLYDLATHKLSRIEEDTNHDGATDSWTDYREGEVSRRRVDSNLDGSVDTWTFYRDGEITRHELDTSGDGFRDRVGFYAGGRIAREEQDNDGDGRPDITNHYDANEKVSRREEDTDRDGAVDLISHYENGRLARRELLGGAVATP